MYNRETITTSFEIISGEQFPQEKKNVVKNVKSKGSINWYKGAREEGSKDRREGRREEEGKERGEKKKDWRCREERMDVHLRIWGWEWGTKEVSGFGRSHTVRKTDINSLVLNTFFIGFWNLISVTRKSPPLSVRSNDGAGSTLPVIW